MQKDSVHYMHLSVSSVLSVVKEKNEPQRSRSAQREN